MEYGSINITMAESRSGNGPQRPTQAYVDGLGTARGNHLSDKQAAHPQKIPDYTMSTMLPLVPRKVYYTYG